MRQSIVFRNVALALLVLLAADARAVTVHWSYVASKGSANAADATGFGSVGYSYNIGTYDVTNSQYVEFLNSKDPTGANQLGLYNGVMGPSFGDILFQAGNANGSKYILLFSNEGSNPVIGATWYDAIRFANWLNNGQGNGDTESGAYTLLGSTPTPSNGLTITRNAGATVFLPSENEWYKAAYNIPGTNSYYQYPTSSNLPPTGSSPSGLANHANIAPGGPGKLTDVGTYTGTTSPYGAFDMGGNAWQWTEALISGSHRGIRGGSFDGTEFYLRAASRTDTDPMGEGFAFGFRVASTPEPSSLVLAALGFIGLAWRLRRR
jgi:formylglycine-generating enzyme required for sulfatase activity